MHVASEHFEDLHRCNTSLQYSVDTAKPAQELLQCLQYDMYSTFAAVKLK